MRTLLACEESQAVTIEMRKPDQIINPYKFGDAFEKKTCIWLKGLPKLQPTNIVEPPKRTEFKSGKSIILF